MTTGTSTCTWDTGAMYGCTPACVEPATVLVRYRKDSYPVGRPYFEAPACDRHARLFKALAESQWIETVPCSAGQG